MIVVVIVIVIVIVMVWLLIVTCCRMPHVFSCQCTKVGYDPIRYY